MKNKIAAVVTASLLFTGVASHADADAAVKPWFLSTKEIRQVTKGAYTQSGIRLGDDFSKVRTQWGNAPRKIERFDGFETYVEWGFGNGTMDMATLSGDTETADASKVKVEKMTFHFYNRVKFTSSMERAFGTPLYSGTSLNGGKIKYNTYPHAELLLTKKGKSWYINRLTQVK